MGLGRTKRRLRAARRRHVQQPLSRTPAEGERARIRQLSDVDAGGEHRAQVGLPLTTENRKVLTTGALQ